ncbi:MAG: STN domain-containing protein, partial [Gemmatimonadales bacterium]
MNKQAMACGSRLLLVAIVASAEITGIVAGASRAAAQSGPERRHDQVPRFLRMPGGAAREPAVIDPRDEPVLMRRIAVNLRDVKYRVALDEISLSAGVQFVYAGDLLSRYDEVTVRSYNITVAAALTEVLRGAGVDVEVGAKGTLILLRQPSADSLAARAAADSVAAEAAAATSAGGFPLAPIRTVGIA